MTKLQVPARKVKGAGTRFTGTRKFNGRKVVERKTPVVLAAGSAYIKAESLTLMPAELRAGLEAWGLTIYNHTEPAVILTLKNHYRYVMGKDESERSREIEKEVAAGDPAKIAALSTPQKRSRIASALLQPKAAGRPFDKHFE